MSDEYGDSYLLNKAYELDNPSNLYGHDNVQNDEDGGYISGADSLDGSNISGEFQHLQRNDNKTHSHRNFASRRWIGMQPR